MTEPSTVIFEVKTVKKRHPGFAVREAVGQLLEYRYFLGPRAAELCIVLDRQLPDDLVAYVEGELGMMVAWWTTEGLRAAPSSKGRLGLRNFG